MVTSSAGYKLTPPAKALLRRLLRRGTPVLEAGDTLHAATGIRVSRTTITGWRKRWGIRTPRPIARPSHAPCDLCGDGTPGARYPGRRWNLEGEVCGECRRELNLEVRRNRRRAARQAEANSLSRKHD